MFLEFKIMSHYFKKSLKFSPMNEHSNLKYKGEKPNNNNKKPIKKAKEGEKMFSSRSRTTFIRKNFMTAVCLIRENHC